MIPIRGDRKYRIEDFMIEIHNQAIETSLDERRWFAMMRLLRC